MKHTNSDEAINSLTRVYNNFCESKSYPTLCASDLLEKTFAEDDTNVIKCFIHKWEKVQDITIELNQLAESDDYYGTEGFEKNFNEIYNSLEESFPKDWDEICHLASSDDIYRLLLTLLVEQTAKLLFSRTKALDLAEQKAISLNSSHDDPADAPDTFMHEDMSISSPFESSCGRLQVDPIKIYGLAYSDWYYWKRINNKY